MTFNFKTNTPRPPRSLLQGPSADPQTLPLKQHPKWPQLVHLINRMILNHGPNLRPHFLELLNQADLL